MIKKLRDIKAGDWIKYRGEWQQVGWIEDYDCFRGSSWIGLDFDNVSFPNNTSFQVMDDGDNGPSGTFLDDLKF